MESWYACAERAKPFKFLQCNWRSEEAQWGRFCFWLLWLAFLKMTGELQAITNLFQPAEIHLCETTSTICKSLEWEQRKGWKHGSVFVFAKDLQSLLHITYAYSAVYGKASIPPSKASPTHSLCHIFFQTVTYIKIPADCFQPPTHNFQTPWTGRITAQHRK